jgi:hypothetical protein
MLSLAEAAVNPKPARINQIPASAGLCSPSFAAIFSVWGFARTTTNGKLAIGTLQLCRNPPLSSRLLPGHCRRTPRRQRSPSAYEFVDQDFRRVRLVVTTSGEKVHTAGHAGAVMVLRQFFENT